MACAACTIQTWTPTRVNTRKCATKSLFFKPHRKFTLNLRPPNVEQCPWWKVTLQYFVRTIVCTAPSVEAFKHSSPSSLTANVSSFLGTSLRFWHATSAACASIVFTVVNNKPLPLIFYLCNSTVLLSCPIVRDVCILSVTTPLLFFLCLNVFCGNLKIPSATSRYFFGRWTVLKLNFISRSLHLASRFVDFCVSKIHISVT